MSTISTFSFAKSTQNSLKQAPMQELPSFKMQNLRQNYIKTRNLVQTLNPVKQRYKPQGPKARKLASHGQVKNPPSFYILPPKVMMDQMPDIPSCFSPQLELLDSNIQAVYDPSAAQSSLNRLVLLGQSSYKISNFKI